jgi:hypothetical protein
LLTVKQLRRGVNKYWAKRPSHDRSSLEILCWDAIAELASFVELTMEPEDLPTIAPTTYIVIWGLEDYYRSIGQLPPFEVALLMLVMDRVNAGLSARGDDTKRPGA